MKLRLVLCLAASILAIAAFSGVTKRADAAVGQLTITQSCSTTTPGTVKATFVWSGAAPGSLQTWLDLSLFNNGWQPATFLGTGPFNSVTNSYTWDGLIPNTVHYVRVNQQLPAGNWDPSQTFTFATLACAAGSLVPVQSQPAATGSIDIVVTAGGVSTAPGGGPGVVIVAVP
jgi:hypothetical protein